MLWLNRIIEKAAKDAVRQKLDEAFPAIMRDVLNEKPKAPLTKPGFIWAGALHLHDRYGFDLKQAGLEFRNYIEMTGEKFGDPDFDWSALAARDLATDMLQERDQ